MTLFKDGKIQYDAAEALQYTTQALHEVTVYPGPIYQLDWPHDEPPIDTVSAVLNSLVTNS